MSPDELTKAQTDIRNLKLKALVRLSSRKTKATNVSVDAIREDGNEGIIIWQPDKCQK